MTVTELAKSARGGKRFKRTGSARVLHFGDGKGGPFLVADHYDQTAAMLSDDLVADDWVFVDDVEGQ